MSAKGIDLIDKGAPKEFSYVEEAILALTSGKKTAKEIAMFILQKRKSSL